MGHRNGMVDIHRLERTDMNPRKVEVSSDVLVPAFSSVIAMLDNEGGTQHAS